MIDFTLVHPPNFHIVTGSPSQLYDRIWRLSSELRSGLEIKTLQGPRMRTRQSMFAEFAAALQFPYYFGANWDALDECLSDMAWMPAVGYGIVISQADEVLRGATPEEMSTLVSILASSSDYWSSRHPPKAFHVVLGTETTRANYVEASLSKVAHSTLSIGR